MSLEKMLTNSMKYIFKVTESKKKVLKAWIYLLIFCTAFFATAYSAV